MEKRKKRLILAGALVGLVAILALTVGADVMNEIRLSQAPGEVRNVRSAALSAQDAEEKLYYQGAVSLDNMSRYQFTDAGGDSYQYDENGHMVRYVAGDSVEGHEAATATAQERQQTALAVMEKQVPGFSSYTQQAVREGISGTEYTYEYVYSDGVRDTVSVTVAPDGTVVSYFALYTTAGGMTQAEKDQLMAILDEHARQQCEALGDESYRVEDQLFGYDESGTAYVCASVLYSDGSGEIGRGYNVYADGRVEPWN